MTHEASQNSKKIENRTTLRYILVYLFIYNKLLNSGQDDSIDVAAIDVVARSAVAIDVVPMAYSHSFALSMGLGPVAERRRSALSEAPARRGCQEPWQGLLLQRKVGRD